MTKIAIGSDHAGYLLKEHLKHYLSASGFILKDYGTGSEQSMDYPDTVHPLARDVESGEYNYGLLICGSGNGVAITANKYKGIRAALCWKEEITTLARLHNDANILVLPARFISFSEAERMASLFFSTEFEGGRHEVRVRKISEGL